LTAVKGAAIVEIRFALYNIFAIVYVTTRPSTRCGALNEGGCGTTGWQVIGLYLYCVLLAALAAAVAAALATAPHWIWPS